jgi:DNA invertase Pin-like site-specific DNA recombinase
MTPNTVTHQTETAPTEVRFPPAIEQTVHRLLVRWALRVLRCQDPIAPPRTRRKAHRVTESSTDRAAPDDRPPHPGDRPPEIRAHHLERLAVIYIRQSTSEQVRVNTGSAEAQRGLAELPRRWGWPETRIRVIEDDLGVSGTSITGRTGLRDLLEWIDRGEVGLVVVREVTRLSRDTLDSEIFLRKATQAGVLISANNRLFDAATKDLAELFGLKIQALLGWYENEQRVRMLQGAKTAKVRLGFAVTRPPIGYVQSSRGHWILDPDLQVQGAIRRVFALYQELRSVGKVVKAFRAAGSCSRDAAEGKSAGSRLPETAYTTC